MTPELLQRELDAIGWTQAELARKAGVTRTTALRWLAGAHPVPPSVGDWIRTLAAFHRANPPPAIRRSMGARGKIDLI